MKRAAHARIALVAAATVLGISPLISSAQSIPRDATKLKHIVIVFQENVSFDHYFGTYPNAKNERGETAFNPRPDTPSVNGLTAFLLDHNPNSRNPFRLSPKEAQTCDQDHTYTREQRAYDRGAADRFVQAVGNANGGCDPGQVMGYFDGNTVMALWNYAQNFAMSDNSFQTTYGPSTPGALNLISGQTHGATPAVVAGYVNNGTVYGDLDPEFDDCSKQRPSEPKIAMVGTNIGDLLDAKHLSWGWFQGGFAPTGRTDGVAICESKHRNISGIEIQDYIPHHQPFQYYKQTANPHHLPPSSVAAIGTTDQANHQYDLGDFWKAVDAGHIPAVSFLKAAAYQDGHAGYSNPIDEQAFLVNTINRLQQRPEWQTMAIVIAYDDSDGWYDHVMPPLVNASNDRLIDALTAPGACGRSAPDSFQGRCGYGPRLPLLVISPFSKRNYVDHAITDQTSILRLIEDNFALGRIGGDSLDFKAGPLDGLFDFKHPHRRPLILDPSIGRVSLRDVAARQ